jgi:hypothetical protein
MVDTKRGSSESKRCIRRRRRLEPYGHSREGPWTGKAMTDSLTILPPADDHQAELALLVRVSDQGSGQPLSEAGRLDRCLQALRL